jgi:uncharacterized protein YlxW (UPF0749 family)
MEEKKPITIQQISCTPDEQSGLQSLVRNISAAKERVFQIKDAIEEMQKQLKEAEGTVQSAQAVLNGAVGLVACNRGDTSFGNWSLSQDCSSLNKVDNARNTVR